MLHVTVLACRTPDQKLDLNRTIKALEAAAGPASKADLTGTTWRLVCTNSASSSGGKFGPFIGPVEQVDPWSTCRVMRTGRIS